MSWYVKHKNEKEAIEVIDRALANGYELYEGVSGYHNTDEEMTPTYWECVGIDGEGNTLFEDRGECFGEHAEELSMEQVRERFPFKEGKNMEIIDNRTKKDLIPIEDLDINDAFEYQGVVYVKTDEQEGKSFKCLRLSSGYLAYFFPKDLVTRVNLRIIVED